MTSLTEEMIVYSLICGRLNDFKLHINDYIKRIYSKKKTDVLCDKTNVCRLISDVDCCLSELEDVLNG